MVTTQHLVLFIYNVTTILEYGKKCFMDHIITVSEMGNSGFPTLVNSKTLINHWRIPVTLSINQYVTFDFFLFECNSLNFRQGICRKQGRKVELFWVCLFFKYFFTGNVKF